MTSSIKPFLILQLRPETEAADDEFKAILEKTDLAESDTHRIRLDQNPDLNDISLDQFSGIIVGGGPGCVSDPLHSKSVMDSRIEKAVLGIMPEVTDRDFPFLGCCYGIGILGQHLGARVSKEQYGEPVGAVDCTVTESGRDDPLLVDVEPEFRAFVGHKEALQHLPVGCEHLVESASCPYQMVRYAKNVYATQFHPEADGASFGVRIQVYRHAGYFPPEEAEQLLALCDAENITMPERILRNFVLNYQRSE